MVARARAAARTTLPEGEGTAPAAPRAGRSAAFDRGAQRQRKRMALLQEAARLINARGIAAVSLEEVASSLGISKAAVYYYFTGKQELVFECYALSFGVWEAALDEAGRRGRTGLEKVEIFVRTYLEDGLESLQPMILVREQEALDASFRQRVEGRRRALRDRLRAFLEDGARDGSLRDVHPKVASTMMGAVISSLLRNYRADGGLDKAAFIEAAMGILLGGLRA